MLISLYDKLFDRYFEIKLVEILKLIIFIFINRII